PRSGAATLGRGALFVRLPAIIVLNTQTPERPIGDLPNVLRAAVEDLLAVGAPELESELGGDHHLPAEGLERLSHDLFVLRAVDLGRVEERHAALRGCPNERDPLVLVGCGPVTMAQSHRAVTDGRHF